MEVLKVLDLRLGGWECEAFAVVAALSARGQQSYNAGLYTNSYANGIISHTSARRRRRRRGPISFFVEHHFWGCHIAMYIAESALLQYDTIFVMSEHT